MSIIHPTAIIGQSVKLAADVRIGPYCIIDGDVSINEGTVLHSHVVISGRTSIGKNCAIYPFASLGHSPQDLKFHGEASTLSIGNNNVIREYVTMNPGTEGGGMKTTVGNHCLFMVSSHVAHDCIVGDHVILANNAMIGGHVEVGEYAIVGGMSAVHQFVRIGKHSIIGGMSGVVQDVIPFGSVVSERASLAGLNLVGLKRRGFDRDTIHALRNAYKMLFEDTNGTLAERMQKIGQEFSGIQEVMDIIGFMSDKSNRSFCMPRTDSRPESTQAA